MNKEVFWTFKKTAETETPQKIDLETGKVRFAHCSKRDRNASCFSLSVYQLPQGRCMHWASSSFPLHQCWGRGSEDNAIEEALLRQDDKRRDYNLRGREASTGETDKWWDLRRSSQAFTNDCPIFFLL